jgi:hypothetical protein
MDVITQYQEICQIQPHYNKLTAPYAMSSRKRVEFNLRETELSLGSEKKGGARPKKQKVFIVSL